MEMKMGQRPFGSGVMISSLPRKPLGKFYIHSWIVSKGLPAQSASAMLSHIKCGESSKSSAQIQYGIESYLD
jgi:hypothetical protein